MRGKGVSLKSLGWVGIAAIGAIGGLVLGRFVVGENTVQADRASYAQIAGNPDALDAERLSVDPCYDCADGSGGALRARAARAERMDKAFRELGAVATDPAPASDEDYDYGGRFDDPAAARTLRMRLPVPVEPPSVVPDMVVQPAPALPVEPPPAIEDAATESRPLD